jgi:hypothetical protein
MSSADESTSLIGTSPNRRRYLAYGLVVALVLVLGAVVTFGTAGRTLGGSREGGEHDEGDSSCSCTKQTLFFANLSNSNAILNGLVHSDISCCSVTQGLLQGLVNTTGKAAAYGMLDALYRYANKAWACPKFLGTIQCLSNGDRSWRLQPVTFPQLLPGGDAVERANIAALWNAIPQALLEPIDVENVHFALPVDADFPFNQPNPSLYYPRNVTCDTLARALRPISGVQDPASFVLLKTMPNTIINRDVNTRHRLSVTIGVYDAVTFQTFLDILDGMAAALNSLVTTDVYASFRSLYPGILSTAGFRTTIRANALAIQNAVTPNNPSYALWNASFAATGFVPTPAQQAAYLSKLAQVKPAVDGWVAYLNTSYPWYSAPPRPQDVYLSAIDEFYGRNNASSCVLDLFYARWFPAARDGPTAFYDFWNAEWANNLTLLTAQGQAVFGTNFTAIPLGYESWFFTIPPGTNAPNSNQPVVFPGNWCSSGQERNVTALNYAYLVKGNWELFSRAFQGKGTFITDWYSTASCDNYGNALTIIGPATVALEDLDVDAYGYGGLALGNLAGLPYAPAEVMFHEYTHLMSILHYPQDGGAREYRRSYYIQTAPSQAQYLATFGTLFSQQTEGLAMMTERTLLRYSGLVTDNATALSGTMLFYYVRIEPALEWAGVNIGGWNVSAYTSWATTTPGGPYCSSNASCATRWQGLKNRIPTSTIYAYATGFYRWRRLEQLAFAACGAAYDTRAFVTLTTIHGTRAMDTIEREILTNYIARGCPSDYWIEPAF